MRPSGDALIARACILPGTWAHAKAITVVSLVFADQPMSSERLPVTLRVGFNHAPAYARAVYAAAKAGNMPALQAALDDGGSTEEADYVSVAR